MKDNELYNNLLYASRIAWIVFAGIVLGGWIDSIFWAWLLAGIAGWFIADVLFIFIGLCLSVPDETVIMSYGVNGDIKLRKQLTYYVFDKELLGEYDNVQSKVTKDL